MKLLKPGPLLWDEGWAFYLVQEARILQSQNCVYIPAQAFREQAGDNIAANYLIAKILDHRSDDNGKCAMEFLSSED